MKKFKLALAALMMASMFAGGAIAQQEEAELEAAALELENELARASAEADKVKAANWAVPLGVGLGAGLTLIAAGYGISLIGSRAVESMARQPEVATNIQGAMIVSAALIEGATFFALIVVLLVLVLF